MSFNWKLERNKGKKQETAQLLDLHINTKHAQRPNMIHKD